MTQEYITTDLINFGLIKGTFRQLGLAVGGIAEKATIATKDGVVTASAATGRIVKRGAIATKDAVGRIVKEATIATKDGVVTAGAATGRITLGAVHSVASAIAEKTKR